MDNIIITGQQYTNNSNMLVNILAVAVPILIVIGVVLFKESKKVKIEQKKCGCGKSVSGFCDSSHANLESPSSGSLDNSNAPEWSK